MEENGGKITPATVNVYIHDPIPTANLTKEEINDLPTNTDFKLEDLKLITNDLDVLNLIYLKECIKSHNSLEYFNYTNTDKGEEEK